MIRILHSVKNLLGICKHSQIPWITNTASHVIILSSRQWLCNADDEALCPALRSRIKYRHTWLIASVVSEIWKHRCTFSVIQKCRSFFVLKRRKLNCYPVSRETLVWSDLQRQTFPDSSHGHKFYIQVSILQYKRFKGKKEIC